MKIILIEAVNNLGNPGDMVEVKDGYAMNYLIPTKKAMDARDKNVKALAHKKKILEHKFAKQAKDAGSVKERIEAMSCTLTRKSGENEKLFGSVTSKDIEEYLRGEGIPVDKKDITITDPIKTLGIFTVDVKVYQGVDAKLKVWVVPQDKKEEASK